MNRKIKLGLLLLTVIALAGAPQIVTIVEPAALAPIIDYSIVVLWSILGLCIVLALTRLSSAT